MGTAFILASQSPRRRDLLAAAGFEFETLSANVTEKDDVDLTLRELTTLNAVRKGLAVARLRPEAVVLAADTLVAIDGQIIGKPADLDDATRILQRLSGRAHEVCSTVFICQRAAGRSKSFCEISRVHFRRLNRDKIDRYFAKVNPLDKAGAYGAQGRGTEIIEKIEGSFANVVGLPIEQTVPVLASFGITPAATSSR